MSTEGMFYTEKKDIHITNFLRMLKANYDLIKEYNAVIFFEESFLKELSKQGEMKKKGELAYLAFKNFNNDYHYILTLELNKNYNEYMLKKLQTNDSEYDGSLCEPNYCDDLYKFTFILNKKYLFSSSR